MAASRPCGASCCDWHRLENWKTAQGASANPRQVESPELRTNVVAAYVAGGRSWEVGAVLEAMQSPAADSYELAFNRACALVEQRDHAAAERQLQLALRSGAAFPTGLQPRAWSPHQSCADPRPGCRSNYLLFLSNVLPITPPNIRLLVSPIAEFGVSTLNTLSQKVLLMPLQGGRICSRRTSASRQSRRSWRR